MFCPTCKTEYRENFTTCADCGVKLVTELPQTSPKPDLVPADWQYLLTASNDMEAAMIESFLDGEQIPVFKKNASLQSLGLGMILNIEIFVPASCLERSHEILQAFKETDFSFEIDDDFEDFQGYESDEEGEL